MGLSGATPRHAHRDPLLLVRLHLLKVPPLFQSNGDLLSTTNTNRGVFGDAHVQTTTHQVRLFCVMSTLVFAC